MEGWSKDCFDEPSRRKQFDKFPLSSKVEKGTVQDLGFTCELCIPISFLSDDLYVLSRYSGLNLNQDKATKPQTVQIVRQGEAAPYWFKFNPL